MDRLNRHLGFSNWVNLDLLFFGMIRLTFKFWSFPKSFFYSYCRDSSTSYIQRLTFVYGNPDFEFWHNQ